MGEALVGRAGPGNMTTDLLLVCCPGAAWATLLAGTAPGTVAGTTLVLAALPLLEGSVCETVLIQVADLGRLALETTIPGARDALSGCEI